MIKKSKALVCVDASYWQYFTMYGAVSEFKKNNRGEAELWLKPAKETDQSNLPNLLNCESFKRILKKFVMKRCETLDWLLRSNFQEQIDLVDKIDFVFAMDDFTSNNFRKQLYPGYKAQRKLVPKQFDAPKIRNYVFDVIFKELELEQKYGYKFISVPGAEADDVIAVMFQRCADDYQLKVLFASDHDFSQLEGVNQMNLYGKDVKPVIDSIEVSPKDYLLSKILLGDSADNISKVFKGIGQKKVMKLIFDKSKLKSMLKEDQAAAYQFQLNKKLIAFSEIPKCLSDKIAEEVSKALYSNDVLNDNVEFANLQML